MAGVYRKGGYGENASDPVDFLPAVADVLCWVGLLVCAVGFLLLFGEGLAAVFGHSETTPIAPVGP